VAASTKAGRSSGCPRLEPGPEGSTPMSAEREPNEPSSAPVRWPDRWAHLAVALAALCGLALLIDSARKSSATYDEVTYLRVAARWWRTGDQKDISRMGSPLTFWKLQQVPVLWLLDQTTARGLVNDPVERQEELLPLVRMGSLWIWLVTLLLT